MVGGVPGLPPPNMPGQLGNIPTMGDQKTLLPNMQGSYGNMPMTGGSYVHPPSTHGPTERLPTVSGTNMPVQHVSGSYGNNVTPPLASTQSIPVSGSQLYNQMFQVPPPPLLGFSTPQFVQGPSGDLIQASSLIPTNPNYQWSNIMNQEFPPRIGANIVTTSTPPTTVATGQQSASAPLGREAPHTIAQWKTKSKWTVSRKEKRKRP